MRRFRESNLSCDHLRECLNELLGVGPTTSLRELLSARHLVWECGPNRNKRRTETRAGTRGATPGLVGMGLESTYLPVGLLLNPRSRLMDSSSPGPKHATYLRHALTTTCSHRCPWKCLSSFRGPPRPPPPRTSWTRLVPSIYELRPPSALLTPLAQIYSRRWSFYPANLIVAGGGLPSSCGFLQ